MNWSSAFPARFVTRRSGDVRFPDALGLAFIPKFASLAGAPDGFQRPWWKWRRRAGFRMLFRSGNPEPATDLVSKAGLDDFLDTRQFRGICWPRELSVDVAAASPRLSLLYGYSTGFTPVRDGFHPGVGSVTGPWLSEDSGEVTIHLTVRFKLGKLLDFAQAALTSHRAPSAWMRIEYRVGHDSVCITLRGSAIPDQWLYIGWHAALRRFLKDASADQVDGFLTAGKCKDAPERPPPIRFVGDL